jgi:hypothetical protein
VSYLEWSLLGGATCVTSARVSLDVVAATPGVGEFPSMSWLQHPVLELRHQLQVLALSSGVYNHYYKGALQQHDIFLL